MATAAGRYGNLDRSFKLAARSLLTAFSREDVNKAFSSFTDAERERLYQMFVYVIRSLHGNIEEEFDTFCQEIQVGTALDKVDQFVEEQNLDVLSSDKQEMTSIEDIKDRISKAKKDEIEYMMGLLEKENNAMKAQIELLKKDEDLNATRTVLEKLTQWNSACQR